jgi:hypothetical protein
VSLDVSHVTSSIDQAIEPFTSGNERFQTPLTA